MHRSFPRIPLAHLPTPLESLPRLSEVLGGPRIFIKRDDLTGLAGGGNKTRKLEFLVAEALGAGADTLVTLGAAQSNHCRQTAAAAARCGLRCILVLRGDPQPENSGNLLLDRLLGAELRWAGPRSREEVMDEVVEQERVAGRKPYAVPLGGSTPLGALAYAKAMEEMVSQAPDSFDRVVFASSSGGTHAGLMVGAATSGFEGQVLGISIDEPLASLQEMVAEIATGTARLLNMSRTFAPGDVQADAGYLGAGYGIVGEPEREALRLLARTEGILLDPVYTARAAAGMIDLIRRGDIAAGERVVFWHTGGVPALWAYGDELQTLERAP
jgi:D-cysteine desulfhydrase family pyridoxal phosphate-dependent enzyme